MFATLDTALREGFIIERIFNLMSQKNFMVITKEFLKKFPTINQRK